MSVNAELVKQFLEDPLLWSNLDLVLETISNNDPVRLAKLNAKITSWVLITLENRKRDKQFAISQLYMASPKKNPFLFFELFYASQELYPDPKNVLNDCEANKDTFRSFVKAYKNQEGLSGWRRNYDVNNWLDKLEVWLKSEEAQKFMGTND